MGGQVRAHRRDRGMALKVRRRVRAGRAGAVLRPALDPQEPAPGRGVVRLHCKEGARAPPLGDKAGALDRCGGQGREVDVVEQAVIGAVLPRGLIQKAADDPRAMGARGLERIVKVKAASIAAPMVPE